MGYFTPKVEAYSIALEIGTVGFGFFLFYISVALRDRDDKKGGSLPTAHKQ